MNLKKTRMGDRLISGESLLYFGKDESIDIACVKCIFFKLQ